MNDPRNTNVFACRMQPKLFTTHCALSHLLKRPGLSLLSHFTEEDVMSKEEKTFKVPCAYCNKHFHVRFALRPDADEEGEDKGKVMINCPYCGKDVMITIPRGYIEKDNLLKSVKAVYDMR